jgi:hypothetical protein
LEKAAKSIKVLSFVGRQGQRERRIGLEQAQQQMIQVAQ